MCGCGHSCFIFENEYVIIQILVLLKIALHKFKETVCKFNKIFRQRTIKEKSSNDAFRYISRKKERLQWYDLASIQIITEKNDSNFLSFVHSSFSIFICMSDFILGQGNLIFYFLWYLGGFKKTYINIHDLLFVRNGAYPSLGVGLLDSVGCDPGRGPSQL